jgi:NADH-quinone oxidoreductase subunit A
MNLFDQYLPILILLILSIIFAIMPLISSYIITNLINKKNPKQKIINLSKNQQLSGYECGITSFSDARLKIPIKFAVIAILFIIFDLEMLFLIPCSLIFYKLSLKVKLGVGFFLLILSIGFLYEWKKGALDWYDK